MPPRAKYTREEITEIALGIVAESGVESLNARSLAEAMGTSTRPIFTAFRNMEELESAVRESAMKVFGQFAEKETPDMFKSVHEIKKNLTERPCRLFMARTKERWDLLQDQLK